MIAANMTKHIALLLILLAVSQHVSAIKILAIISMPLRSHYMAFQTLFRELANRGHDVTVMNNFPDDKPVPNLRFIDLQANSYNRTAYTKHPLNSYEHVDSNIKRLGNVYGHTVTKMLGNDCENLFINENAKAHLAEGVKYDVIFVEQFISDCGLVYAAALYDAPIIGITSHTLMPWSYPRLGISFDFAADAFYFSNAGPNPSILHKVEAVLIDTFLATFGRLRKQITISGVFGKYLPEYSLDVERVAKERMKMMFAYQHFSVTGARVLPPQVLEIGGIHVGKPKPVTPVSDPSRPRASSSMLPPRLRRLVLPKLKIDLFRKPTPPTIMAKII